MNRVSVLLIAVASTACAAAAIAAPGLKGQALLSQAKIHPDEARAIALKARPGTVVDQELEREPGGSGLRYSFDVRAKHQTFEVGVDAQTGAILENGAETKAQEKAEAKADHKKP